MATIRQRKLKNGLNSYNIQVKIYDKGSGKEFIDTTTWRPDRPMSPKQEERALAVFVEKYEKQVKDALKNSAVTGGSPNTTFREFAAKWLDKTERDCSLNYFVKSRDAIELSNSYIGGYKLRDLTPAVIQSFYDKLDKMQKTTARILPKPEFRAVLESKGFNYKKLRYEYHVQSCTLANALAGKPISKIWSTGLSEKTKIPFEKLFDEKIITEPYAYETIHQIKRTIRAILSMAKKNRLIEDNYASADYITFPKRPQSTIVYMDDEDANKFYDALIKYPDVRYRTAMLTFLLTGFRRGEVTGLQWGDVDFDEKTITVSRSITTVKGYGKLLKKPKTEKSERTITIAETLVEALKEYREWWLKNKELLGDYMEDNDYLFTQENGKVLYPSTFTGWLNKVLKSAGLDHHSLHSLRHTNITMQIAAGVPLVTVAARAGHARTSTTTDIYSHFIKSSDRAAAESIDKAFKKPPQKTVQTAKDERGIISEVDSISPQNNACSAVPANIDTEDTEGNNFESPEYFKQVKAEMQKLGFESYEEYEEYRDFMDYQKQKKAQKKNDYSM